MPLLSLTTERQTRLLASIQAKRAQVDELEATSELELWRRELSSLRDGLEKYLAEREAAEMGAPTARGKGRRRAPRAAAS